MRNTILFDLDGTLLPMDFNDFMKRYFYFMGKHFAGRIDPETLTNAILAATDVTVKTNDGRTNYQIFMDHFATLIDDDISWYEEHFTAYYEGLFEHVKESTSVSEEMLEAVAILKDKGYDMVIATNPFFPYRANLHRIRWAGLDANDFIHITSMEDNKHNKPYTMFYEEVLSSIDKQPDDCLMVGNDVFDDLPAGKIGIETYLITDHLINKNNDPINADHQGTYQDFVAFVKELPSLIKTT